MTSLRPRDFRFSLPLSVATPVSYALAVFRSALTRSRRPRLSHSPIMEAFGNAKTVYNSNSSRFGKFVQLSIGQKGNIQGGRVVDCILLRSVLTCRLWLGP